MKKSFITEKIKIREIKKAEYDELENFLYSAIFVPEGSLPSPREIIFTPELQVYIKNFGEGKADFCFVAEFEEKIIGVKELQLL